ncbi:dihydrolipoyl dehydrogenase [Aquella oligotrophica]|uniref:Dihydrolipoyl dehydrogenase n=1 Tax=Aquella oligotrophica TaxID=2067065 RepID=A0A2I7N3Q5_9NEIS|nr:dihydrolipoyl dehydrogenase [Aquella oligotrophica]AUR51068.1 dihydrolipoyl dehydrogenase [Aquella oligotrophica]
MSILEIRVPDIGGHSDVNVAEVYVKIGDKINIDDNLIMLETDKATMEVPADKAGTITEVLVKVGSKINEGDVIIKVEAAGETKSADPAPATKEVPAKEITAPQAATAPAPVAGEISCDVVVLGAGPGGYTAAFRSADLGLNTVLIEKHPTLGGVCLNVGCIPSKALLHVAKVINEADEMSHHGVSFGKPALDIDKIRDFKSGVVGKLTKGLDGLAKQRKVQKVQGLAKFTSPYTIEVDTAEGKKTVRFKNAIIAAGSHSFKVPGFPFDDPRVIDSTGALTLENIPERMLVVGGGIIGLEMAEVYSTLGSKITVVELGDGLIPGADRDVVKVLENRVKKRYEAILTKTKCAKVEPKIDGIWVTFEGPGAPTEPQKFDKILVAAGRRPNGKTIGAEAAGVIVQDNGFIPADKQQRTNVSHIYAIGDVIGQPMLAHKAVHEGRVAAENCAGMKSFFDARVIPGIAYTDPEVAWVGVTETEAKAQGLEIEVGKFPWAASGRALGNGRDDGFTKIITDKNTHKIIGAAIVGAGAGELLAETCLAIEMDCDIHDVALTVHAHPTLSESVAFACEIVDGSITDLYMPKKKK